MQDPTAPPTTLAFADLGLSSPVLEAVAAAGYESPSPIQAATIPVLLAGKDMLGQAQTGTGKTAAFALPMLSRWQVKGGTPQGLVLVPTRELAIQVAEAFQRYASHLKGFHVLPIYGGQSYTPQLMSLKRGAHIVVGTPGRVMDHIKRGTLDLGGITTLVLDEADEMLQMGFVDDIEWILEQIPSARQVALFSATLPAPIRRIAQKHLRDPVEVTIKSKTSTAANIRQRYWIVSGVHKLDALTRILEAEAFDGMLVFARTKQSTVELAERLEARGFRGGRARTATCSRRTASALSRDSRAASSTSSWPPTWRPAGSTSSASATSSTTTCRTTPNRTCTASAARAVPDARARRFCSSRPRERNMLRYIERATRQPLEPMDLPTIADVNEQRVARFTQKITEALAADQSDIFRSLIEEYEREHNVPAVEIAAALASLLQGGSPLLLKDKQAESSFLATADKPADSPRPARQKKERTARRPAEDGPEQADESTRLADEDTETFRLEVGYVHGVKPGNIVGAIANVAGLSGKQIGHVDIREDHTFVGLPKGMPGPIMLELKKTRVAGQMLRISPASHVPPKPLQKPPKRQSGRPQRK